MLLQGRMQRCVCRGGGGGARRPRQRPRKSAGGLEGAVSPPWISGRLEILLWCSIRVYAGIGVVVVGGRGILLFKFSIFHSIENTCKKIFLWEYLPVGWGGGGGGGLSPQSPPLDPPLY